MTPPEPVTPNDLWEGDTDADGFPLDRDDVYSDNLAPHVAVAEITGASAEQSIAARYRLPEEFWGSREIFKRIRQAAWASQTHPDAVLACVLARAAGAAGHEIKFDSGRGPHGTLSLFVCLLAKSGIGKSEAANAAATLVRLPRHLLDLHGNTDMEMFRDGMGIGTGEGLAEVYMGSVERETGKMKPARGRMPAEPETEKVRAVVRHRAFFYVDEGEMLTKLMRERQGSTLGPALRTAWTGGPLGQANARDETTRFVPRGSYAMGIAIGYQPDTAMAMLSDVGPGTPQRFLWFGAQDTEMPEEEYQWPEPITLPADDAPRAGIIAFPREVKDWFRAQTRGKHTGSIEIDPMDSHEPLMRAKLAALLCYLDGRMLVDRDDWVLGGMLWSVSRSIRDRLIRHRDAEAEREAVAKRSERIAEATEVEMMRVTVSADVDRVARRVVAIVAKEEGDPESDPERRRRSKVKKDRMGRDKPLFDAALAHAKQRDWLDESDSGTLSSGWSSPR